jgi:hypothetical protein
MLEIAPILDHYPQERGARFAEGGGRFTRECPAWMLRLRYLTWKLCGALVGLAAAQGAGRFVGCGILGCSGRFTHQPSATKRRRTQT